MHIITVIKNLKSELHRSFLQLENLKIKYVLTQDPEIRERIERLQKTIAFQNNQLRDFEKRRPVN